MGKCPSEAPDYRNFCSASLGERYDIPNWCGPAGDFGRPDRDFACNILLGGGNGEWGRENLTTACKFPSGTNNSCSGSGTGVAGIGTNCERLAFLGDPLQCCLLNYDINGQYNNCFSDAGNTRTCAPENRGFDKTGCQSQMLSYCTIGNAPSSTTFTDPSMYTSKWASDTSPCYRAVRDNLNTGTQGGVDYARELLGSLYNRYYNIDGFQLVAPGNPGFNAFQDRLLRISLDFPAAARTFLNENLCNTRTRESISRDLEQISFCGCHLPEDQYRTAENQLGVGIQCDSLCAMATSIPISTSGGAVVRCEQNVCIIDGVTLNLVESSAGDISFSQICGSCGPNSQCSCSIVDLNINVDNSTIGNIDLSQECGTQQCYKTVNGILQPVDCFATSEEQDEEAENGAGNEPDEEGNRILTIIVYVLAGLIVVMLVIGLVLLIVLPNRTLVV